MNLRMLKRRSYIIHFLLVYLASLVLPRLYSLACMQIFHAHVHDPYIVCACTKLSGFSSCFTQCNYIFVTELDLQFVILNYTAQNFLVVIWDFELFVMYLRS